MRSSCHSQKLLYAVPLSIYRATPACLSTCKPLTKLLDDITGTFRITSSHPPWVLWFCMINYTGVKPGINTLVVVLRGHPLLSLLDKFSPVIRQVICWTRLAPSYGKSFAGQDYPPHTASHLLDKISPLIRHVICWTRLAHLIQAIQEDARSTGFGVPARAYP